MLSSLFVAIILQSANSAKLVISADGKPAGTVSISQKILPDGSKLVQSVIELNASAKHILKIRLESSYSSKGIPQRKSMESTLDGKRRRLVLATFTAKGAEVVIDEGGTRKTKSIPLADAAPRENMAEFWFIRDRPKAGDSVRAYNFDLDKFSWELTTTTYLGLSKEGHMVKNNNSESTLDDHGLPIRIVTETATFKRQ